VKQCSQLNCPRQAKSGGLCIGHGGGQKCKHPGCDKTQRGGGLCKTHGGGVKCSQAQCTQWVPHGGTCEFHSQNSSLLLQAGVLTRNPSATAPFPSFSNMISPMLVQYSTAISILNPTEDDVETPSTTTPSASASSSTTANHTLTHLLDSMPYMYSLPSLRVDPPEEVVRTNRLKHQLNPIDELIHPTQDAAMTMTSLW
ncbi:unnamed protein product, partial [Aphanomyces euteiches]